MEAGAFAFAEDQVGATVTQQSAGSVEIARGVFVAEAVASFRVASRQVEALMTDQEEQSHQEQTQSGQMWQEGLLEVEEGGLGVLVLASIDGPIETLVQVTAKLCPCR